MGSCWSCGSNLPGGFNYAFTCPACTEVQEIKKLRQEAKENFYELANIQRRGFEMLSDRLTDELSEVATVIEWGFEEVSWQLQTSTSK